MPTFLRVLSVVFSASARNPARNIFVSWEIRRGMSPSSDEDGSIEACGSLLSGDPSRKCLRPQMRTAPLKRFTAVSAVVAYATSPSSDEDGSIEAVWRGSRWRQVLWGLRPQMRTAPLKLLQGQGGVRRSHTSPSSDEDGSIEACTVHSPGFGFSRLRPQMRTAPLKPPPA